MSSSFVFTALDTYDCPIHSFIGDEDQFQDSLELTLSFYRRNVSVVWTTDTPDLRVGRVESGGRTLGTVHIFREGTLMVGGFAASLVPPRSA